MAVSEFLNAIFIFFLIFPSSTFLYWKQEICLAISSIFSWVKFWKEIVFQFLYLRGKSHLTCVNIFLQKVTGCSFSFDQLETVYSAIDIDTRKHFFSQFFSLPPLEI